MTFRLSCFSVPKKSTTPAAQRSQRRPLSQWDSPVFISDDDDDNIVVKSTWRTRHSRPKALPEAHKNKGLPNDKNKDSPSLPSPPFHSSFLPPSHETPSPKRTFSAPSKLDELSSSEEEFTSLLERLKKKKPLTSTSFLPKNTQGKGLIFIKMFYCIYLQQSYSPILVLVVVMQCKTPGCFLQLLSNPGSTYGRNFKQNKEDLTSKLYQLYNASVFDSKLPANLSVKWNKKMRKTAGYCITGQERGGGSRYARIELSEKVCDSADRLRDTLIHEMCHAATWLINGVRDGHGKFWKFYARKSTVVHPELPMVSRCHSYDIKYKFQYQCTRCKNTIGRHSKSLDTQRFVCALCTGQLVLLTPSKPRAPTPFASFVKQHYGTVRQELAGQSHADVMRKLSADFASMTKLS
uniref:Germ cell nuclear acidic peptidase n=1 Tax=Echeneis naucrates TaxID=173247 RepID=A0A665UAP3_ECHNA